MIVASDSNVLLVLSERLQNALENHLIYSISNTYDTISTVSLKKYFCISDEEASKDSGAENSAIVC